MTTLDIKQEAYFPFNFKVFGGIVILGSVLFISSFGIEALPIGKAILLLAGLVFGLTLLTARYGLTIDIKNKSYTVYVMILGYKSGQPERFRFIDKFYINQVKEKVIATTRTGAKFDASNLVFKAYMRLDNGAKVHLDTDKKESALERRMADYRSFLAPVYEEEQAY